MKKLFSIAFILILLLTGCTPAPSIKPSPSPTNQPTADQIGFSLINTWLKEGDFLSSYNEFSYSSEMKHAIGSDDLRDFYNQLLDRHGKFLEANLSSKQEAHDYYVYNYLCRCEKGNFSLSISFDKQNNIAGFSFNPPIDDSIAEKGEPISIGTSEMQLPGILLMPENQTCDTLAIIVHGSGPQDMNGTMGLCHPYKDIAEQLSDKGIAVYRYAKRTYYHPDKIDANRITPYEEQIQDVLSAIKYFNHYENRKFKKIFLIGHSQGGYILPKIAKLASKEDNCSLSGLIYMGANASHIEDLIVLQTELLAKKTGSEISAEWADNIKNVKAIRDTIKTLNKDSSYTAEQLFGCGVEYYLYLKDYSPTDEAKEITLPMLFLSGNNDKNVPESEFMTWKNALSDKNNTTFRNYEDLNHLFIKGSGWLEDDILNSGTVDKKVTTDMSDWMKNQ